jgi:hypothetical protein
MYRNAFISLTPFLGVDHGFVEALFTPANKSDMRTDNAINIRLPGPISVVPMMLRSVKVWLRGSWVLLNSKVWLNGWDSPICQLNFASIALQA